MDLLETADKYGLSPIIGNKVFILKNPLQICIDNKTYLLNMDEFIYDINIDLYCYLIKEYNKNNTLMLRLYKQMLIEKPIYFFNKYQGKDINLEGLCNEMSSFKNIVYNPENNDKFIAIIYIEKQFIHIYEFVSNSLDYKAKYIHAKYEKDTNLICHLDYSINQYTKEQYEKIIQNPYNIEKSYIHEKIWRVDGNITIESFYNIIFCMFNKNEKYIKELFNE